MTPTNDSFLEAELQASKAQYERRREEAERAAAAERERSVGVLEEEAARQAQALGTLR